MSSHRARRSNDIARWRGTVLAALALTTFTARLAAYAPCVTNLGDSPAQNSGSLRACITAANTANTPQTITFSPALIGGTITVATPLTITAGMTISGLGPNLLTVSGGNNTFIFDVESGAATVAISGLTLANGNSAGNPGAAILSQSPLTVNNVTFTGNNAGAIATSGDASLTVTNSTFYDNPAYEGGGINVSGGIVTVTNSTFYGNSASISGGAIFNSAGALTINNSTISGNSSTTGGGILNNGGTVTLNNSIVAGNTNGDCNGCPPQDANNLINISPQLSSLGWYGGSTQTLLPLPGSPAIGKGTAPMMNATNMDQRGFARPTSGTIDAGAVQTNYLLVTTTQDLLDMTPDCTSGTGNTCSLRDALTLAAPGGTDIAFLTSVYPPASLAGTITLLDSPLPGINGNLDLVGPGATVLTVSGGGSTAVGMVFTVNSSNAAISGIAIANANSGQFGLGGGIFNNVGATLTVNNSAFFGGSAGNGGGIANDGTLEVYNSTFSGNSTPTYGGGLFNGGTLVVTNSTISGNSAPSGGAGIYNSNGTLVVNNSTFSGNTSGPNNGGGISNFEGTLTVTNSILTGDTGGECAAIGGNGGCPSDSVNGNVVDPTPAQPILSPLGWNGGPTQTMLPLPASEGVCAGMLSLDPGGLVTDQRGFVRTSLANGCLDAGAVQTNYLLVTTSNDVLDAMARCDPKGDGPCSLRDALTAANPLGADIAFNAGVTGTIGLNTVNMPLPAITGNLDLFGPGAGVLTVSGGSSAMVGTIFTVNPGANAAISGIGIDGSIGNGDGGGISNSGALTVSNCILDNNQSTFGGGIFNNGTLLVNSTTIYGGLGVDGGGIYNFNETGILTLNNSTLSNNQASTSGGGIYNDAGTLIVNNSTVSTNSAASAGGGIYNFAPIDTVGRFNGDTGRSTGPVILTNSIVAGNTTNSVLGADDCDSCGKQSPYNLIGGAPQLAALGSYGGPFQTMLPLPGSPAVCAGSATLDPGGLTTDERGFPRLNTTYTGFSASNPCLDLGAVQTNYQSIQFAKPSYSGAPGVAVSTPAAPVVSVTENGQNIGAVAVTLSFMGTQPTSSSGLGPETTVAGTGATFPALTVRPGGSYTLLASLSITPSVTVSGTAALHIATPGKPPTIAKSFSPTTIVEGGNSTLSFTITNPNASVSLSAIAFADTFPAGMEVFGAPGATNTCGGTFTTAVHATTIRLSGGSLPAGGSCSLSVKVLATAAGQLNNTTGTIRSTPGGMGATSNTATLTVNTPITLVQDASLDAGINNYGSLAFNSPNTAGNFIAVVVRVGLANETLTIHDSLRNTYLTAIQRAVSGAPGGETLAIFYAQNIAGGPNTVTVSDTTSDTLRFAILEYSGVATSNALDTVVSTQGTSATPTSKALTTTTDGDLLLAAIISVDPEIFTPGPAYTAEAVIPGEPNTKLLVEQRIQPTAGSAAASAKLSGTDPWGVGLAAFHPAQSQCLALQTSAASISAACKAGPTQ
jgi:hypothetical protein